MKIAAKRFFRKLWKVIIVTFWRYVVNPVSYSISGMRFMKHERAYRVELVCGILAWPVCCYFFGFTWKLMVVTIEFMILLLTECRRLCCKKQEISPRKKVERYSKCCCFDRPVQHMYDNGLPDLFPDNWEVEK